MANKKTTDVNLKGILNSLEAEDEAPQETTVTEFKKENVKKYNRSFMLTEDTIKQLKKMSFTLNKDMGTIVTEALDMYYAKNQEVIENTLK